MKNIFYVTLFLFLTSVAFSQSSNNGAGNEAKFRLGIKAGIALATYSIEFPTNTYTPKMKAKVGKNIGVFSQILLGKNIVFEPGVFLIGKGASETNEYGDRYSIPSRFNYIELPLNILYRVASKNGTWFMGAGLSPAFNIGSMASSYPLKSSDLGLNILAAYQLPLGFSLNLSYSFGLLNVSALKEYTSKIQNRYLGITAGYLF